MPMIALAALVAVQDDALAGNHISEPVLESCRVAWRCIFALRWTTTLQSMQPSPLPSLQRRDAIRCHVYSYAYACQLSGTPLCAASA
jgi:hypothetical protein